MPTFERLFGKNNYFTFLVSVLNCQSLFCSRKNFEKKKIKKIVALFTDDDVRKTMTKEFLVIEKRLRGPKRGLQV